MKQIYLFSLGVYNVPIHMLRLSWTDMSAAIELLFFILHCRIISTMVFSGHVTNTLKIHLCTLKVNDGNGYRKP